MKIFVNDAQGSRLRLVIPTPLLLNGFAARLLPGIPVEKGVPIQRAQMESLFAALRAFRKEHPGWALVEVQSHEGEYVRIEI